MTKDIEIHKVPFRRAMLPYKLVVYTHMKFMSTDNSNHHLLVENLLVGVGDRVDLNVSGLPSSS